jgi:hypothetical protein
MGITRVLLTVPAGIGGQAHIGTSSLPGGVR